MPSPQAFISTYAPRLRTYANSLLAPSLQPTTVQNGPLSRATKRGTIAINYAEDGYDDDTFDEGEGPKRPTGLRSLRRDAPSQEKVNTMDRVGKELTAPVELQGIWRKWMTETKLGKTEAQLNAQTNLPLVLIPIRIDLDIPSFTPAPAFPVPSNSHELGIDPTLPAYKTLEPTPPYQLRDVFLWNLYETLITPDQFALGLVSDLDLPNHQDATAIQISNQIRQQLEEYAAVALHPLFNSTENGVGSGNSTSTAPKTVLPTGTRGISGTPGATKASSTPMVNAASQRSGNKSPTKENDRITASADPAPSSESDLNNPDDTYRCIITLNVNLFDKLYTDKFEWSLLHPPGTAERFAKQTCADLGLAGEWVPAITHAIYEAVLRLKKKVCESGGLVGGYGSGGEVDNMAVDGQEAGWRFDNEQLAEEWEPKVETLTKEEIEKREGDRERQIRRLRRETARFSSSTGLAGGMPQPGYFDNPEYSETPLGRGERSKKKRRFRSLSPVGRANTPGGAGTRGTPDVGGGSQGGYGGGGGTVQEWERQNWKCSHCGIPGSGVWAVRDGPSGPRTLCNNCGFLFERDKKLPSWSKDLHRGAKALGSKGQ
ncbi:MAG: Chromatin structure remodeling complex protein sfh1 [Peltula sp. TS41687]|nr:MAG: Chromatin structure remodeling complex protein sfh1 [Peltula sp. TS41687]